MPVLTDLQPTAQDLDAVIDDLKTSWTATITVCRQAPDDIGYREVFLSLDGAPIGMLSYGDTLTREIPPGAHRLRAHNTLFARTLDFTIGVGDHASFAASNRAGRGTYSVWAFWLGFLGAGPIYITLERTAP